MEELKSLVERSREGDLRAFAEVVRRFQDMAHGYAYSILGDFHLAEDVAQEALVDAYLKLRSLKQAGAFPGWFRRIVFTHASRITRKRQVATIPLEKAMETGTKSDRLSDMRDEVLEAIRALPDHQRVTTTLFYINGYSQNEVAEFLEVPVTTVQKRLHDARQRLKRRMMNMVEETLKDNAPDERFSQRVIAELLGRPKLLEIEGHPVREVAESIRSALPDYEYIEGEEIVSKSSPFFFLEKTEDAYHVDEGSALRVETTVTILHTMVGRMACPRCMVHRES